MGFSRAWFAGLALLVSTAVRAAEPIPVIATLQPLGWIAADVGGERTLVTVLVPPGASPHGFEPRPSDVAKASRASIAVVAGGGLDDWIARVLDAGGAAPETLSVTDLAGAPHAWLDPIAVRELLVPALAQALTRADPEGGAVYARRATALQTRLTELDADVRKILGGGGGVPFVAFHDAWSPFANRYGLHQAGVIENAPGEDPSPRHLAQVLSDARQSGARAILVEPQSDARIAATLAREFDGTIVRVDPVGDDTDPERADYAALLRFNARAFATATKGIQ